MPDDNSVRDSREKKYVRRNTAWYTLDDECVDSIDFRPTAGERNSCVLSFAPRHSGSGYDSVALELTPLAIASLYEQFERAVANDIELHVIELFKNSTRCKLIDFVLNEMDEDGMILRDIADPISVTETSVRKAIDEDHPTVLDYGVLTVKNEDVNHPHYQRGENRIIQLLQSWDGIALTEFFGSDGQGALLNLVEFFLIRADPEEWYSKRQIDRESTVNQYGINNNIEVLVDTDFVLTKPGKRADTVFQINRHSSLRAFLFELNEALRQEYAP